MRPPILGGPLSLPTRRHEGLRSRLGIEVVLMTRKVICPGMTEEEFNLQAARYTDK